MPVSLIPDYLFAQYTDIQPEFLQYHGIALLLCDLDYTLAPKSIRQPDQILRNWIAGLQASQITCMIVSNNRSGARVEEFCRDLGIAYQGHAGKPGIRGLKAAMRRASQTPEHTAMLGDKLLTDVLAARRAGVLSLMVEPLGGAVTPWQKVLHTMQKPAKWICQKNLKKNSTAC